MSIIPFDPPHLFTAELKAKFVDIPESAKDDGARCRGWDKTVGVPQTASPRSTPPLLQRRQTMSGNILVVTPSPSSSSSSHHHSEEDDVTPVAFWLQRKLGTSAMHGQGLVRLGYKLRPDLTKESSKLSSHSPPECWELETDEEGRPTLVAIHIMDSSVLDKQQFTSASAASSSSSSTELSQIMAPCDELSALQMIARHSGHTCDGTNGHNCTSHVVGTNMVATCPQKVYAILPFHRDGSLLHFCQTVGGPLEEPLARFIFQQIVQVRRVCCHVCL
jgi:hypothetical protein